MAYQRGSRSDFDNWVEKYGAKGWSWQEALKAFVSDERADDDELDGEYGLMLAFLRYASNIRHCYFCNFPLRLFQMNSTVEQAS